MPATRKSVLRKLHHVNRLHDVHVTDNTPSSPSPTYGVLMICLRGCPYSEQAASTLFRNIVPRKVLWVSSRKHPMFETCKRTFRQQTYPICLALPVDKYGKDFFDQLSLCSSSFFRTRPPHVVRLGGLTDCLPSRQSQQSSSSTQGLNNTWT